MNTPEFRAQTASQRLASATRACQLTAFIGLDGFVDIGKSPGIANVVVLMNDWFANEK